MTLPEFTARRLIIAGAFAFAVAAAPAAATVITLSSNTPVTAVATCAGGEEADFYTGDCTPIAVPDSPVPDSPAPFTNDAANPDIPEIDGVPCTGRDSGACIGLAEDAPQYVAPESSVGSSPTVTGSTN